RLQSQNDLRAPYNGPLAIRAYDTPHALRRARHEFAVMHEVSALGFPAPKPLLLEQECLLLGGPFLILPWVDGVNLLDWLRQKFVRVLAVARQLARVQCALHELPTSGCVASAVQFLDRRLDELEVMISNFGLDEIADGLQWLRLRRPATEMRPSILHLDFHPINIVVDAQGAPNAVLDWSDADIGDRHADVAMTLVLLRTAPVDVTSLSEKFVKRPARWLLARRYLRVYQHAYPLDPARLTYYSAWAALRRLAVSCTWRRAGPWVHGYKKPALRPANRSHERALRQVSRDATGISLRSFPKRERPATNRR